MKQNYQSNIKTNDFFKCHHNVKIKKSTDDNFNFIQKYFSVRRLLEDKIFDY